MHQVKEHCPAGQGYECAERCAKSLRSCVHKMHGTADLVPASADTGLRIGDLSSTGDALPML